MNSGLRAFHGYNYGNMPQDSWFNGPGLGKHLNLSDTQAAQLNQAYNESLTKYNTDINALNTLPDADRAAKLEGVWVKFNDQLLNSAKGVLSNQQYTRFQQLNLQDQGIGAFNNPAIQQQLKFTPDQVSKLKNFRQQQDPKLHAIEKLYGSNPAAANSQCEAFYRQSDEFYNRLLTDQQRQLWQQMVGEPYNYPPSGKTK